MSFKRSFLAVALLSACATPRPELTETKLEPANPGSPKEQLTLGGNERVDVKTLAAGMVTANDCIEDAISLKRQSSPQAWDMLVACIRRPRYQRGDFTDLRLITDPVWHESWQKRPDAPRLVMELIARRGGDLEADLPKFQTTKVPVFSLAAAMKQPDVYKNRYILVHASPGETKVAGGLASLDLSEVRLKGVKRVYEQEGTRFEDSTNYAGRSNTTYSRHSDAEGSYSERSSTWGDGSSQSTSTAMYVKYGTELGRTGARLIGRMKEADPFLEIGHDYIFLLRFEGNRTIGDSEEHQIPETVGVASVVAYVRSGTVPSE